MNIEKLTFDTRDEYARKPIAIRVVQLLTSDARVSPLVIDGNWGSGKTEFCHKLKNMIDASTEHKYKSIYIDAFQADHADEPLMTLMSAVLKIMPPKEKNSLIKKAVPALRVGLKAGLKAGVGWVLRTDAATIAKDFEAEIKAGGDEAVDLAVETLLKDHIEAENNIDLFKQALSEIAKASPVVIFIDELDRCRPDFAVSMLESIKHVFSVEGVKFVLITNMNQLRQSIDHCYGIGDGAQRYLDKFIGFSFSMPDYYKPHPHSSISVSEKHLETLIRNSNILKQTAVAAEGYMEYIKSMVTSRGLSLREVETFVRHIEIYQTLSNGGFGAKMIFGPALLMITGIFLFCFGEDKGKCFINETFDGSEIANIFGKNGIPDLSKDEKYNHGDILAVMMALDSKFNSSNFFPKNEELKKQWESIINDYSRGGGYSSGRGSYVRIITSVIETLMLSSAKGN